MATKNLTIGMIGYGIIERGLSMRRDASLTRE